MDNPRRPGPRRPMDNPVPPRPIPRRPMNNPVPPRPIPRTPDPPAQPRKVFLNFRGDELPIEFMESLMMQLGKEKISIFIERDELRGRELDHRFTRIEESNVALVIFSKRYAESEWCLEELVKMKECVSQDKLVVIPVFYKVSKDDVLRRAGEFGNHFTVTRQRYENDQEKIQRWEESLTSIAGTDDGIHFSENGNNSDFVAEIIRTVKLKLNMPTSWPTIFVFLTTLVACIVMNFSAAWIFGFPVFVAIVWQIFFYDG